MARKDLTVSDILNIPVLKDCKLLAGSHGTAKRIVSRVSVMDSPDVANWMWGGEFLLTTGYVVRDNPLSLKFIIEELCRRNVAALGIKLGRFLTSLPDEILAAAEEMDFPLLCIPGHLAFSDILGPVVCQINTRQNESSEKQTSRLLFQDHVSRSFLELMLAGGGVKAILHHLGALINVDVAFFDRFSGAWASPEEKSHFVENISSISSRSMRETFHSFPLDLDEVNYGHIIIDHPREAPFPESWKWTLDYAKIAILLNIQKENARKEARLRYKDNFLQGLVLGHINRQEDIHEYLFVLGPEFLPPFVVILGDTDTEGGPSKVTGISGSVDDPVSLRDEIWSSLNNFLGAYFGRIHSTMVGERHVSLVSLHPDPGEKIHLLEMLLGQFKENFSSERGKTFSIVVGGSVRDIGRISSSFRQASCCMEFVRATGSTDALLVWEKMGLLRLLMNTSNREEIKIYVDQYLGAFGFLKPSVAREYLETLYVLCRNGWNLRSSAAEMHLHYNTLRYRIRQISEIVSFDIEDPETRQELLIALKLYFANKEMHIF
ncbi:MAG TPA: PucR family transcriptional regulator ligand-binding domain-containing protein [Synergistales bacterium]|nr:PucR family transcriptional regulator ligand-binding domain-containing protein [Synergistales bacterium]HRV71524.1 PucR family transcriptional regulator ligand-binding domain-containing protein [Thermovirgaceae bacterium]